MPGPQHANIPGPISICGGCEKAEAAPISSKSSRGGGFSCFQDELMAMRRELAEHQADMKRSVAKLNDGMQTLLKHGSGSKSCNASPRKAVNADIQPMFLEKVRANTTDDTVKCTMSDDLPKRQSSVMVASADEEMAMLLGMFEDVERTEQNATEEAVAKRHMYQYTINKLKNVDLPQLDMIIDSSMGVIITMNAIFIGLSMDMAENGGVGWLLFDLLFSGIFIIEICIKLKLHGARGHFCGPTWGSNCFDFSLVVIDLLQLVIGLAFEEAMKDTDLPSASLFRIIRLLKLARLLRLFRSEVFTDLLSMISGLLGGMTTLGWSMVLFFVVVYVVALIFREFFGRAIVENVYEYFNNVPRSMFTTFRCSFGDCSASGGVPIFEHVHESYGTLASVGYCLFVFCITIGLFNVISAIFVESTMVAALALQTAKKKEKMASTRLWNDSITTLIRNMMDVAPDFKKPQRMSDNVTEIHSMVLENKVIDDVVKVPEAASALISLDISEEDFGRLSDILDPDNGGSVTICELIDGLRRLRGDPKRSDIVSVDLMIRALQKQIAGIEASLLDIHDVCVPSATKC